MIAPIGLIQVCLSAVVVAVVGPPTTVAQLPDLDQIVQVVMPEGRTIPAERLDFEMLDTTLDLKNSYRIKDRLYVERVTSRCFFSTVPKPGHYEHFEYELVFFTKEESPIKATANLTEILKVGFRPELPTLILIGGWTQNYEAPWLQAVRKLVHRHKTTSSQNVIAVDFNGATGGFYFEVAARVNLLASYLAYFINSLLELGADRKSMHLVGHSLGAQIAGFASRKFYPRLGRITALDAAKPCFGKPDHLRNSDADQVDLYHYDDKMLGLSGQHGNFDIFINGGAKQPGCRDDPLFNMIKSSLFHSNDELAISHTFSTVAATRQHSIRSHCQQMAYECPSYEKFLAGECGRCDEENNQCFFVGFNFQYARPYIAPLKDTIAGKRMFMQMGESGACLNHFQIVIWFDPQRKTLDDSRDQNWFLRAELEDEYGKTHQLNLHNRKFRNVFTGLLVFGGEPSPIKRARVQVVASWWRKVDLRRSIKGNTEGHELRKLAANFMSHFEPKARESMSTVLCPTFFQAPDKEAMRRPDSSLDTKLGWLELEQCTNTSATIM